MRLRFGPQSCFYILRIQPFLLLRSFSQIPFVLHLVLRCKPAFEGQLRPN